MRRLKWARAMLGAAALLGGVAVAQVGADPSAASQALEKLRASYIDLPVADFAPAPVAGLYEFLSNDTLLYYSAEQNLLFVGEIYAKDGHSLTAMRLAELRTERGKDLPLGMALKIGDGPKRIIEFTDPECPYCQAYHKYISGRAAEVTRYIFFYPLTKLHPKAAAAAVHILCAADPLQAFAAVYERKINLMTDLKDCAAGEERLAKQEAIGDRFGISSTPTLILGDGSVVNGFDQARVAAFLAHDKDSAKTP